MATALVHAVRAATPGPATADLLRRAEELRTAVLDRHPPEAGGSAQLAAEHQELAQAAADLVGAVRAWLGDGASGTATGASGTASETSSGAARSEGRSRVLDAAAALHDDLRVHHAHEAGAAGALPPA